MTSARLVAAANIPFSLSGVSRCHLNGSQVVLLRPLLVSGGDLRRPLSCVGNGIDRDVALSTLDFELFNYCGRKWGLGQAQQRKGEIISSLCKTR